MKLRDKNNSYYERRVVFMKNIIINNIDKITIGVAILSISGLLYIVKELVNMTVNRLSQQWLFLFAKFTRASMKE